MLVTSVKKTKKSRQSKMKGFVQGLKKKGSTGQLCELGLDVTTMLKRS